MALLIGATAGCKSFQPRELSAIERANAFDARTLGAAALGDYLRTNGVVAAWPPPRWTLTSLTGAALFYHPDLEVLRADVAAAQAGALVAAERQNPTLSAAPGYNATHGSGAPSYWIADVALSLPIETAGKRGHRVAQAGHLTETARQSLIQTAWQVRMGVRACLAELCAAQEAKKQSEALLALQTRLAETLAAQVEAGETVRAEALRARTQEAQARLAVLQARQEVAAQRVRLAAAIGVPAKALDGVALDFGAVMQPPAHRALAELRRNALVSRADLLAALAEYAGSQAALQLEIAKQYPDFELGPAYQFDQGENKWALGVSVSLPVFNRNGGAIAAAEARRRGCAAKFQALQARVIAAIEQAEARYPQAVGRWRVAESAARELAARRAKAEALLASGSITRAEALVELIDCTTAESACLEARHEANRAWGELEDALQWAADWTPQMTEAAMVGAEEAKHE